MRAGSGDRSERSDRSEQGEPSEVNDSEEIVNEPMSEALLARIARLEGRIAALENALDRRSLELRLLQRSLCAADLVQLARIADGLPPLARIAHQLEYWTETAAITPADLESTLEDLWTSLTPSPGAPPPAPRVATSPRPDPADPRAARGLAESSE